MCIKEREGGGGGGGKLLGDHSTTADGIIGVRALTHFIVDLRGEAGWRGGVINNGS